MAEGAWQRAGDLACALFRRITQVVTTKGFLGTIKVCFLKSFNLIWHYIAGRLLEPQHVVEDPIQSFDDRLQVNTVQQKGSLDGLADISSPNWKHGVIYQPIREDIFRKMMCLLDIAHQNFTFIDLGCGKGRAILLAADYPFLRIIGVEYSESLANIARNNVAIYRNFSREVPNIEILCLDAVDFAIPAEPCVIFIFNSFGSKILEQIITNMINSLEEHPRRIIVLYANALHSEILSNNGFYITAQLPNIAGEKYLVLERPTATNL